MGWTVPRDLLMTGLVTLVAMAVVVGLALLLSQNMPRRASWAQLCKAALRTFRSIGAGPAGPLPADQGLRGDTAVVLNREVSPLEHQYEPGPGCPELVALHLHVRNRDGQAYFVVARSDGTTFIKPIDEGALKAVLKDRYRPPQRHAA